MKPKIFYRIANNVTKQGLWYDYEGKFTGLIHNEYSFCNASKLPMSFDPTIVGWLSATDKLETLFLWFSKDEIKVLEKSGYELTVYEATDYKEYENHWIINQASSIIKVTIPIDAI
jgi:hypothetical protein